MVLLDLGRHFNKTILFNDKNIKQKFSTIQWDSEDKFINVLTKIIYADSTLDFRQKEDVFLIVKRKMKIKEKKIQQSRLSGFVKNENGEPINYAMVYFSNTTFGTYTDSLGYYSIEEIPKTMLKLVISYFGYKTEV